MKTKLLLACVLAALASAARADTVSFLGPNPTSGAGAFSNTDPGTVILAPVPVPQGGSGLASLGGLFFDRYDFSLTAQQNLTIAFATNTFAGGNPQLITNFQGAVFDTGLDQAFGGAGLNADSIILGPELASACIAIPNCQVFGGSAILGAGNYYLGISGNAAVDAGYGGNISTAAVPGPIVGAGIPGIVAAGLMLLGLARRRRLAA